MTASDQPKLAGVMGWPISHSLSPRLHGYWLREHRINGAYVPLPVKPQNLEHALRSLSDLGFQGVNLTVPHKEKALPFLDDISKIATHIGAVNTVFANENGSLFGTNTDAEGFLNNLRLNARNWDESKPAVIFGAGGAARAVVAALVDVGLSEIRLSNRTRSKAEHLAASLEGPITVVDWAERSDSLNGAGLLVNTTTLGMVNQPLLEVSLQALPKNAVVNDLVYAPLETRLLEHARALKLNAVDGLGMLLHQAVPGFAGWFGVQPTVTEDLRTFVLATA